MEQLLIAAFGTAVLALGALGVSVFQGKQAPVPARIRSRR